MKICGICRHKVNDDDKYCLYCGAELAGNTLEVADKVKEEVKEEVEKVNVQAEEVKADIQTANKEVKEAVKTEEKVSGPVKEVIKEETSTGKEVYTVKKEKREVTPVKTEKEAVAVNTEKKEEGFFTNFFNMLKTTITSPSKAVEDYAVKDYLAENIVCIILLSLMTSVIFAKLLRYFMIIIPGLYHYSMVHSLRGLYPASFFFTLIFVLVFVLVLWLITKLFKKDFGLKDSLCVLGVPCLFLSICLLIGFLLGYIYIFLFLGVVFAGLIAFLILLFISYLTKADIHPDKAVFALVLTVLITLLLSSLASLSLLKEMFLALFYY